MKTSKDPITKGDKSKYSEILNMMYPCNYEKAKKYHGMTVNKGNRSTELEDWLQIGRIALWKCGESMEPETYRQAIEWAMLDYFKDHVLENRELLDKEDE